MLRRRLAINSAFIAAGSLLLAACASTPPLGGEDGQGLKIVDASAMPPPAGVETTSPDRPYRLGPGDQILVDVVGVEELKGREFQLDGSGRVSIPLAGTLDATGLTSDQFGAVVRKALRDNYIRQPLVTVNLHEAHSRYVTIDGEIAKPGNYPIVGKTSLMQSVARAQGTSEFAKLSDVVVFRTVGDAQMVALYDLGAIRRGIYSDPEVFPGDVVVVGEARKRRMFQQIVQAGTLLVGPVVALIQR